MTTLIRRHLSLLGLLALVVGLVLAAPIAAHALQAGTSMFGTVTDAVTHQPISGAAIFASGGDLWETELVAQTDASGYYEAQLTTATYTITCSATDQYKPSAPQELLLDPTAPKAVDFALETYPKAFFGWAKDGSGNPIAGLSVFLEADETAGFVFMRSAKTDSNGYYEFYAPAGLYDLGFAGTDFARLDFADLAFDGTTAIRQDASVAPPVTAVSGKVTDQTSGLPVASALVNLTSTDEEAYYDEWVLTDSLGLYTFVAPDGSYSLSVMRATYKPSASYVITFDGTNGVTQNVVLERSIVPTHLTIKPSATTLSRYGASATFTGKLQKNSTAGAGILGKTVKLQRYESGSWRDYKTVTSQTGGALTCSAVPASATWYRFKFYGVSGAYEATTSPQVKVTPRAYLSAPSASRLGYRYYKIAGYVKPKHTSKATVVLQRWKAVNGHWDRRADVTVSAYPSSTDSTSRYSVKHRFSSTGTWLVRAYHYDSGHAKSYSAYTKVYVK